MKRLVHLAACVQTGVVAVTTPSLAMSVTALVVALTLIVTAPRC